MKTGGPTVAAIRSKKPVKAAGGKKVSPKLVKAAPSTAVADSSPVSLPPQVTSDPATVVPDAALVPAKPSNALVLEERQKEKQKQRWTNLPENSKMREKAAQIMALKIQGHDNDEIAKAVGLSVRSLRQYLWVAGKNGWLTVADPQDTVDYELAHRAVSNLDELLHARDCTTGLPDKEITLATLRGTGIFRNHDAAPAVGNSGQQNVLQINITSPTGTVTEIRPGSMQGAPAFIEGEKVE